MKVRIVRTSIAKLKSLINNKPIYRTISKPYLKTDIIITV